MTLQAAILLMILIAAALKLSSEIRKNGNPKK